MQENAHFFLFFAHFLAKSPYAADWIASAGGDLGLESEYLVGLVVYLDYQTGLIPYRADIFVVTGHSVMQQFAVRRIDIYPVARDQSAHIQRAFVGEHYILALAFLVGNAKRYIHLGRRSSQ